MCGYFLSHSWHYVGTRSEVVGFNVIVLESVAKSCFVNILANVYFVIMPYAY